MAITVEMNDFARRQTEDSRFSQFSGSEEELVGLVTENFDNAKVVGDGIVSVPVPAKSFFSSVVELQEGMTLHAEFSARRHGEEPYVHLTADGKKLPAKFAEIICYGHDVLAKDGDNSSDADWEVVSINAHPTEADEPPTPMAMARNFLGLAGGTAQEYTAEEFAEAIMYWS